jgi:hypothetical protein
MVEWKSSIFMTGFCHEDHLESLRCYQPCAWIRNAKSLLYGQHFFVEAYILELVVINPEKGIIVILKDLSPLLLFNLSQVQGDHPIINSMQCSHVISSFGRDRRFIFTCHCLVILCRLLSLYTAQSVLQPIFYQLAIKFFICSCIAIICSIA